MFPRPEKIIIPGSEKLDPEPDLCPANELALIGPTRYLSEFSGLVLKIRHGLDVDFGSANLHHGLALNHCAHH